MYRYLPLILLLAIFIIPDLVSAAPGGFVNCEGASCSACDLVDMTNEIIRWLLGIIFLIFAALMTVAGFGLVTSGGNPSALNAAKAKFTNAIIGIIIVFSAWLIVNTVMVELVSDGNTAGNITGWGPWSEIKCQVQTVTVEMGEIPQAAGNPPDPAVVAQCNDDAALMTKYHGSPIGLEAPGLRVMINCYLADPAVSALTDVPQLYTVDREHPRCSLTNGHVACGPCSHSANSNHYGRGSGAGAKAVDFNSKGSEQALYDALRARKAVCGGTLLFETHHTHISL